MAIDANYIMTSNPYLDSDYANRVRARVFDSLSDVKPEQIPLLEERWVWVTGYKGTDKDMKCMNDFQYEIGKTYDMPEGEEIRTCHSGFHMCLKLEDVFEYRRIEKGNRFFEVRALVRESNRNGYISWAYPYIRDDKLAAKSIEIVRELSADEILAHIPEAAEWPDEIKELALEKNVSAAKAEYKINKLVSMGYSPELAKYICNGTHKSGYELAVALDTQPGISMDTKILAIFSHV